MSTILTTPTPLGPAASRRRATALWPYGLVLVLGAVMGFAFLGRHSLYLDETVSTTLARAPWHRFSQLILHRESNGGLYFFVMRGWWALGHSEFAVRSLSVLATVGSLALVMKVARDLFDRKVALVCGVLLAVDPLIVQYAQDARGYALSLLLVSASSALFVRGCQRADAKWGTWVLYALCSALAAYVNFWAVLVPVAHVTSMLFAAPGTAPWRRIVPAGLVTVVLLLPLAVLIHDNNAAGVSWSAGTTAGKLFTKVRDHVPHAVLDAAAVIVVVGALGVTLWWRRRPRPGVLFASWPFMFSLAWLIIPVALVVIVSFAYMPLFVVRYLIVCLPGAALVVSVGLARLSARGLAVGLGVLVVASAVGVGRWYDRGFGQDWRGTASALASQVHAGDGAMVFPVYMRIPFEWYLRDHPALVGELKAVYPSLGWEVDPLRFDLNVVVDEPDVVQSARHFSTVWLVQCGADLYPQEEQDVLAGLRAAGLRPVHREAFTGIEVVEYQR